jgi:hypothetical protein
MRKSIFDQLHAVWQQLALKDIRASNIFVPWAGEQLVSGSRGIYYVGYATDAEQAEGEPSFDAALRFAEGCFSKGSLRAKPFWRFLNGLTLQLLRSSYHDCTGRLGWSNLFKIADARSNNPDIWAPELRNAQRETCITVLGDEIAQLRQSLVVITSKRPFGILHEAVAHQARWEGPTSTGAYVLYDAVSENLFVHCLHPSYLNRKKQFHAALTETVQLARGKLPNFP